jgi:hypothetical protein
LISFGQAKVNLASVVHPDADHAKGRIKTGHLYTRRRIRDNLTVPDRSEMGVSRLCQAKMTPKEPLDDEMFINSNLSRGLDGHAIRCVRRFPGRDGLRLRNALQSWDR